MLLNLQLRRHSRALEVCQSRHILALVTQKPCGLTAPLEKTDTVTRLNRQRERQTPSSMATRLRLVLPAVVIIISATGVVGVLDKK